MSPPKRAQGQCQAECGGDLQLLEARRELQQARDRMRHLEQALRTAGKVLAPYLAGNGRS
jgi:transcription initiation factor IIE alpha subunit